MLDTSLVINSVLKALAEFTEDDSEYNCANMSE
jgi:hypothetical protein